MEKRESSSSSDRPVKFEVPDFAPLYVWPDGFALCGPDQDGEVKINGAGYVPGTPEEIARKLGRGWPPVGEDEAVESPPEPALPKSEAEKIADAILDQKKPLAVSKNGKRHSVQLVRTEHHSSESRGMIQFPNGNKLFGSLYLSRKSAALDFAETLVELGYRLAE